MTALAWESRPLEERAALNPAFLALAIRESVRGFVAETQKPMPISLAFIVLPLVLHRPTRAQLPGQIRTSLPVWLQEHPLLREGFPRRARAVSSPGREALFYALRSGIVALNGGALEIASAPRAAGRSTSDSREILGRAFFVGRWLSHAGDTSTIFYLWGVRP